MSTYRTNMTFESMHEFDILEKLESHKANLLPSDAHTSAVDEGHYVAVYSSDEAFCEAVNAEIASRRAASVEDLQNSEHGPYDADDIAQFCWKGYEIPVSPSRSLKFTGWTKVS